VAGQPNRRQLHAGLCGLGAHRLEVGDAGGENRGLCVDGEVQLVGGSLRDHARQREANCGIGALHDGGRGGRAFEQGSTHPHVLRALARKDEGVRARL
jgi:hypothetical protein